MRAGSLAKDLSIPRPPLLVTAPTHHSLNKANEKGTKWGNSGISMQGLMRCSNAAETILLVRSFTALVALIAIWYYFYAIAFRTYTTVIASFAFHITDVIFALNFCYTMTQVVITPQSKL